MIEMILIKGLLQLDYLKFYPFKTGEKKLNPISSTRGHPEGSPADSGHH